MINYYNERKTKQYLTEPEDAHVILLHNKSLSSKPKAPEQENKRTHTSQGVTLVEETQRSRSTTKNIALTHNNSLIKAPHPCQYPNVTLHGILHTC